MEVIGAELGSKLGKELVDCRMVNIGHEIGTEQGLVHFRSGRVEACRFLKGSTSLWAPE